MRMAVALNYSVNAGVIGWFGLLFKLSRSDFGWQDGYHDDPQVDQCIATAHNVADASTPVGNRLDVLVTLVEGYDQEHFSMELPDAEERLNDS
jgi:hypothetical protein